MNIPRTVMLQISENQNNKRGWPVRKDGHGTEITLSRHRAPHLCRHKTSGPDKSLKPAPCLLPLIINAFLLPSSAPLSRPQMHAKPPSRFVPLPRPGLLKRKRKGKTLSA